LEEKEKKAKAEGRFEEPEGDSGMTGGWSRGIVKQPTVEPTIKKSSEESGFLSRGAMGSTKPEEKKGEEGPKKPSFIK
jgi:hypothetical protein